MGKFESKYKKNYATKTLEKFLKETKDLISKEVVQENQEKGYIQYKDRLTVVLPTIERYAIYLKVNRDTLYEWSRVHPEFKLALERIKTIQKQILIEKGLQGTYNAAIAKLILINNHGMYDATDLTSGGEKISSFTDEQAEKIAKRILSRRRE